MASLVDACIFVAASGGTGSFVVSAPVPGWRSPAQAGAVNGETYRYRAYSADQTQWEIGTGVYTSGTTTLTRAVITDSSNAGAAVNFTVAPSVALTIFSADITTPEQRAKIDFLTVTGATDLDTIRTTVAALGTASTKNTGTSAGNVPLLDGSGLLDTSILPSLAITDVSVVASQVDMLALTAQKGDIAIRSDLNKSFALSTNSPSTLADWKELLTPTDAVLSVAALTGAISAASLKTALAVTVADITDATANGRSLISAANYAAMRALLDLEAGTDFYSMASANAAFQAIDAQLSSLVRQNSQSAAYTLVLTDGGKHIYHPPADTTARIWTIPANSSVAFPIGTVVTFDNDAAAGAITIAITTDTLVMVGTGSTGSRTLASGGQATALKVTSTRWRISGVGLT